MYAIKRREDLEKINKIVSLQNQVKAIRLKDKLGKQNFHEDLKKVFEPVSKSIKNVSDDSTKTLPETSTENDKALAKLNDKLLVQ